MSSYRDKHTEAYGYIERKILGLLVAVSSNTCLFGQLSTQDVLTPILWADRDIFGIFTTAAEACTIARCGVTRTDKLRFGHRSIGCGSEHYCSQVELLLL
jgi:hypothetical protein